MAKEIKYQMKKNKLHSGQYFSIWTKVYLTRKDIYPLSSNDRNFLVHNRNTPQTKAYTKNDFIVIGIDKEEDKYYLRGQTSYEERGAWRDHLSYTETIFFWANGNELMSSRNQNLTSEEIKDSLEHLRLELYTKNSRKQKGLEIANQLFTNKITFKEFEFLVNKREFILGVFRNNHEFTEKIRKIWKENKGID